MISFSVLRRLISSIFELAGHVQSCDPYACSKFVMRPIWSILYSVLLSGLQYTLEGTPNGVITD